MFVVKSSAVDNVACIFRLKVSFHKRTSFVSIVFLATTHPVNHQSTRPSTPQGIRDHFLENVYKVYVSSPIVSLLSVFKTIQSRKVPIS